MRNVAAFCGLLAAALGMGGCAATLEDFESMTSYERTQYVCERDPAVKRLDALRRDASSQLRDTESALARGYRIHNSCRQQPFVIPSATCGSDGNCTAKAETVFRTVCEDLPVAIDGQLEQDKLSLLHDRLADIEADLHHNFASCSAEVSDLTAQQAFDYHQRGGY